MNDILWLTLEIQIKKESIRIPIISGKFREYKELHERELKK